MNDFYTTEFGFKNLNIFEAPFWYANFGKDFSERFTHWNSVSATDYAIYSGDEPAGLALAEIKSSDGRRIVSIYEMVLHKKYMSAAASILHQLACYLKEPDVSEAVFCCSCCQPLYQVLKKSLPKLGWIPFQSHSVFVTISLNNCLNLPVYRFLTRNENTSLMLLKDCGLASYKSGESWIPDGLHPNLFPEYCKEYSVAAITSNEITGWMICIKKSDTAFTISSAYVHPAYQKKLLLIQMMKEMFLLMQNHSGLNTLIEYSVRLNIDPAMARFSERHINPHAVSWETADITSFCYSQELLTR